MQQKLSELFVQQYQALLAVAFQLARNEDDALDLMQDLAETIARNDRPASSVEHPMAFFRTCLRNARINSLKKAQREIPSEPETFAQIRRRNPLSRTWLAARRWRGSNRSLRRIPRRCGRHSICIISTAIRSTRCQRS